MPSPEKPPPAVPRSDGRMARHLAQALLLILLIIIACRPLISETHDTQRNPFATALSEVPEISPLPTLWMALAIVIACGATLALRAAGHLPAPRCTGLAAGWLLLAAAALWSCRAASNQRLALNATLDWISLPLLSVALAMLLQRVWQMRLTLCVIAASAAASAVESYDQVFYSMPETIKMYEQHKDQLWQQKGTPPDSYQIELFERRLRERAGKGFFSMTNVAGSYFVLTAFAAAGLTLLLWSHRAQALSGAAVVLLLLSALGLTRSRGAMMSGIVGVLLVAVVYRCRHAITARPARAFAVGWAVVLAALLGIAAFGTVTGALPGGSLAYRWWYLETTGRMVADRPWSGVGSAQYGRYYPRYKDIKSPEEITNPHNFLAQAAAEWGIPGLLGMLLVVAGGSWVIAGAPHRSRGTRSTVPAAGSRAPPDDLQIPRPWHWAVAVMVPAWMLRVVIVGHHDANYIVATNTLPILGWLAAFCWGVASPRGVDERRFQNGAACWSPCLLGAGLFAFMVHNLISYSLFVPGSATTFFAVVGVLMAMRSRARGLGDSVVVPPPRRLPFCGLAILATLASGLLIYGLMVRPVQACWAGLQGARQIASADVLIPGSAIRTYNKAVASDPLDPTPAREALDTLIRLEQPVALPDLFHYLSVAEQRDPQNLQIKRLGAAVMLRAFAHGQSTGDGKSAHWLHEAVQYAARVLEMYPSNPMDHLRMSEIQRLRFENTGQMAALDGAIASLQAALKLNSQRDPNEVRRFSAERMAVLSEELAVLHGLREESRQRHPSD